MTFSSTTRLAAHRRIAFIALAAITALAALAGTGVAAAQSAPANGTGASGLPPVEAAPGRLAVGDATNSLLALQRGGSLAAPDSRPIDGAIATRSYQRYLKSFEHTIPERYDSTTGASSSGTGGTSH